MSCVHVPEKGCPEDNFIIIFRASSNSAVNSERISAAPGRASPGRCNMGEAKTRPVVIYAQAQQPACCGTDRAVYQHEAASEFKHMGPHFSTEV